MQFQNGCGTEGSRLTGDGVLVWVFGLFVSFSKGVCSHIRSRSKIGIWDFDVKGNF